jgi:hypothetical protein
MLSLSYLPWPPWATQQRKDYFYLSGIAQGDEGKYNIDFTQSCLKQP